MSRKRARFNQDLVNSQFETQESQSEMPYASQSSTRKRRRASSSAIQPYRRVPRGLPSNRPGQRTIIPVCAQYDIALTADARYAFGFDMSGVSINGVAGTSGYNGMASIIAVYDMIRVKKVEFTILPAATGLDYNAQTVGTGATNIPYIFTAVDYNDNAQPNLAELLENPTVRAYSLNKVIKRTIYPRLEGSNGVIDVGNNYKNQFMKSTASSTQQWNGLKLVTDNVSVNWTYGQMRVHMKVFLECMQSK